MSLVRRHLQPVSQRFPAPHQVAHGQRLLGILGDNPAENGYLIAQHPHGHLHRPAGQPIGLVEPKGVSGDYDSRIRFVVDHERIIVRPTPAVNGRAH